MEILRRIWPLLITMIIVILPSCGGNENDEPDNTNKYETQLENLYNTYKKEIIGSWNAYEVYKSDLTHEAGWYPISTISWSNLNFTFNVDGTGTWDTTIWGVQEITYETYMNGFAKENEKSR